MDVARTIAELREFHVKLKKPIGLVPTMGNLHQGHLNLVKRSTERSASTITTIFVNPLQFGPNEDFASYPRMLADDAAHLESLGVDVLFAPTDDEMYPEGREHHTSVVVPTLTKTLCGESRPTHFDGVTTVVAKLFNICQAQFAFFGEKDWQQLTVIKQMVRQLDMPIQVEGVPTNRHEDGLAMSSRNQYLTTEERKVAPKLYETLTDLAGRVERAEVDLRQLERDGSERLTLAGFSPDYVAIRDQHTLQETTGFTRELRVFGAAYLGKARLIDNVPVGEPI